MVDHHLDLEKKFVLACPGATFLYRHKWSAAKCSERLLLISKRFGDLWKFEGQGLRKIKASIIKGLSNIRPPTFIKGPRVCFAIDRVIAFQYARTCATLGCGLLLGDRGSVYFSASAPPTQSSPIYS